MLFSRTCDYVTLYGKKGFADMIKGLWNRVIILDYSGVFNVITKVFVSEWERQKSQNQQRCDDRSSSQSDVIAEKRNGGSLSKLEKTRKQILP